MRPPPRLPGPRVCQAMHRGSSNSITVETMEYGMPTFIDMPKRLPSTSRCEPCLAFTTVPEPSMSWCRSGSTSSSKMAWGGTGMTRSTVTTSLDSLTRLLPLDGARGLRGDVVGDPVDAGDLVDDAARHALEQVVGQAGPVGGH